MKKVSLIAAAVASTLAAGTAFAAGTDVVTDGWEVHGYMSSNVRVVDGTTTDTEFGRPDYKTAGTHGKSTNQVEFVVKKHSEYENGVWADYVVRTEFGNGNSYAYSSDGDEAVRDEDGFAVKEAFVELGGILGEDTSIWGGQRYLNRAAGILSGEFWKQSSGIGAGLQTKLGGNTAGIAYVMADPIDTFGDKHKIDPRTTLSSIDLYYYGVDAGIGSLDFDLKIGRQAKPGKDDDGFGASVTLNTSYYGLDGWTQTAIAYGKGVMQNRGVNFGSWSGGDDNAESLFLTSYGVWNISDKVQLGTEATYMTALDQLFGAKGLTRYIVAARPSYKLNENVRLEATASYGHEEGDKGYWGRTGDDVESNILNLEVATAFTANSDYFGRPQIKPYISYIKADDEASAKIIGIENGKDQFVFGVHTEIWF
ncbi:carbohydrate porin [Vibrio vulnificus]|uniref:carbohydrate porin n=1 Tax=Vibrio vulnificus TaxID=672 RepID=UPI001CDD7BF6|nr:carbohydrate porin [Vibrio vulnificus]ELE2040682.1 carbohydrate porin [Vibrio vulnificus]MCA3980187.1 carbohydrate porin [Vibrio vulnificus]MCU8133108.1 carbohydrate porin [Vibrio vulnificus]MCU8157704.1 carbohydrate porin [Vibrio vulnificus]MDS1830634.1 carbohydrate porin [Vibrio vulnificus]